MPHARELNLRVHPSADLAYLQFLPNLESLVTANTTGPLRSRARCSLTCKVGHPRRPLLAAGVAPSRSADLPTVAYDY